MNDIYFWRGFLWRGKLIGVHSGGEVDRIQETATCYKAEHVAPETNCRCGYWGTTKLEPGLRRVIYPPYVIETNPYKMPALAYCRGFGKRVLHEAGGLRIQNYEIIGVAPNENFNSPYEDEEFFSKSMPPGVLVFQSVKMLLEAFG